MKNSPTIEPVTVSGWYECANGTVSYFQWNNGLLERTETVACWADVARLEQDKDIANERHYYESV